MTPITALQRDRLAANLTRLLPDPAARLGIAVSGGPDSMALLHLAAVAFPGRIEAATVDHGLRAGSPAEAALVGRASEALGVPHAILHVDVAREASLQAAARRARYEALAAWARERGLGAVATAHHADDQAETLLMRLGRGAGLAGLGGIRERRDLGGVLLVRPLIGWRRSELAAVVADVETADDPSNADPRYDRTHARALLAALGDRLDPLRIAASAAHLAQADEALEWIVSEAVRSRVERCADGRILADIEGLPREIARRILARLVEEGDSPVDGPTLDTAMARLDAGLVATLGVLKLSPGRRVSIEKAPPRR
ncbi:tRNA lysidine(34) synthetase TilS [Rhizorhabdus dicambivorans]|uniref:tRNA(Ile)-lysidine synthase n=1 Tax=Rhizorhabdus dicambivorans TaxID=1850238 RepID=A0A2A4FY44_9SPHN|nr:tRNA lysidine(34) synthetase TilS [Rhizorhabdus dicambivorans]ATE66008.1 tRNA lysidine(34) synthetase TilS [Rhizorhabdus dicambivorans]PCE43125.1 tRNA lysidine(34) synthetase TilS [Rhizorhabdus dicambivorans]